jgi:hypothetical protein
MIALPENSGAKRYLADQSTMAENFLVTAKFRETFHTPIQPPTPRGAIPGVALWMNIRFSGHYCEVSRTWLERPQNVG